MDEPNIRFISARVREVLETRRFDSRFDLREAVKERCAQFAREHKIPVPYDGESIELALERVERGIVGDQVPKGEPPPPALEQPEYREPLEVSREEAHRLVGDITGFHGMGDDYVPKADRDPVAWARRELKRHHSADKLKAARMVMQEIQASIARCEALESALPESFA